MLEILINFSDDIYNLEQGKLPMKWVLILVMHLYLAERGMVYACFTEVWVTLAAYFPL